MADKKPEIQGKDWKAEVIDRSFKREAVRNEFYDKLARLKLHVETSPDAVLDNPASSGLKTFEELQTASEFSRVVNPEGKTYETGKGWTLVESLHSYFRNNVGVTDAKLRSREVALTLYALTRQKDVKGRSINVDYLNAKWKVEIKGGQLFIYDRKGEKIVDGANLRKPGTAPAAAPAAGPAAGPAASPDAALGPEAKRFLERAKEKPNSHVLEALGLAKQKIDSLIATATPAEIANSTNAWVAWSRDGIFKGDEHKALRGKLQALLAPEHRHSRQLWRTEMVAYISQKLSTSARADKPLVMEAVMAAQIVTEFEDDPNEALKTGMQLDEKIKALKARKGLAEKMAKSDKSGDLESIATHFSGFTIKEIKVVVGGDFVSIPLEQAKAFVFMRMVLDEKENRIYAQMENGCRGNLVIIELTPPATPAPAPAPGTVPPRPGGPAPAPGTVPPRPVAPGPAPAPGVVPPRPGGPAPAPGVVPPRPGGPEPAPGIVPPRPSAPAPAPGVVPARPAPAPAPGIVPERPAPAPGTVPARPTPAPAPGVTPARPEAPAPAPGVVPPRPAPAPAPGVTPARPEVPVPAPAPGVVAPRPAPAPAPGAAPPRPEAPAPAPAPGTIPARPTPAPAPSPGVAPPRPEAPTPAPGTAPARPTPTPAPGPAPTRPEAPVPAPGVIVPKPAPAPAPGTVSAKPAPAPAPGVAPTRPAAPPPGPGESDDARPPPEETGPK